MISGDMVMPVIHILCLPIREGQRRLRLAHVKALQDWVERIESVPAVAGRGVEHWPLDMGHKIKDRQNARFPKSDVQCSAPNV